MRPSGHQWSRVHSLANSGIDQFFSFLAKIKIYLVHNCNGKSEKPYSSGSRKSLIEEQRYSVRALFVVGRTDKYTSSCDMISIALQVQDGIGSRRQQYFSNDF